MTTRLSRMPPATALPLLMVLWVLWGWPVVAQAAPRLRCTIEYADASQVHEFVPVTDPYRVQPIDLGGRFRFKAVVVGHEGQVDYVKLYASYRANARWYLMQEAQYLAPAVRSAGPPDALTGRNFLYAIPYGREFRYWCALLEANP